MKRKWIVILALCAMLSAPCVYLLAGTTTNFSWDYGTRGQTPWWDTWIAIFQAIDTELYGIKHGTTVLDDIKTKSPWVDVRAFMDGVAGRPTYATWYANQTATDVTASLQAALTASANGALFIPSGIFCFSTELSYSTVSSGKIRIFGLGPNSILRVIGATNKGLHITGLQGGGHDFVYLENFRIESYASVSSAALIQLDGVAGFGIHSINIDGRIKSDIGLLLNGVGTAGTQQGEISNCSIFSNLQGIVAENGGANGTEIHGCTFAGNSVRDVYYNTNSSGASTFWFHNNHLVYDNVAAIGIEIGPNASTKPRFIRNHFEGPYASMFKIMGGRVELGFNDFLGSGGNTAIDVQGGQGHDIIGNLVINSDVIITGGTEINYLFNTIVSGDESTTCTTQNSFGNRHFGSSTIMPDNYLISDAGTAGNIMTLLANPAVGGAWGIKVGGAGATEDVYLQLGNAKIAGTSGVGTTVRILQNDVKVETNGKGVVLKNAAGTVTKRVRLNDAGDGLIFETP